MADAMNRSLARIMAGGFGTGDGGAAATSPAAATVREVSADDAALQLAYAAKVVIVPGYGLAAAQAQHELVDAGRGCSSEHGVEVTYAIHPVAGRMPGHMNVLLAEANVPYTQLQGPGGDQPGVPADRRRARRRRERRHQPGRPPARQPGLRHADPRRRPGPQRHRHQALDGPRLRRHRQRALHRPEDRMLFADAKAGLTEIAAAVKTLVG